MVPSPIDGFAGRASSRARWKWVAAAGLVVAVAAALRLWNLGKWSYWSDEAFTISDSTALLEGGGAQRLPAHQLSFLVFGLWFRAIRSLGLPFDELWVRALPAVFGVGAVVLTGWLGARVAGKPGAWLGALLVALSPFHLYWSQNARSYSLEVLLAIPAALLLTRPALGAGFGSFIPGLLLLGASAFAHPTALTLLPGIVGFWIYARWGGGSSSPGIRRRWVLAAVALAVAAALLWPLWRSIWVHFHVKAGSSPALYASTCAYYFRPALLAAAAILGIRGALRRDHKTILLAMLGFGTLAAGFLASCLVRANSQYVVAALPFLCLLVGRETAHLAWTPFVGMKAAALALAGVLVFDFAGGAYLYHTAESGHRAPWREACAFVWDRAPRGDSLVTTQAAVVECYLDPANPRPRESRASMSIDPFESDKFEIVTRLRRPAWFLVLDVDLDEWSARDRGVFTKFLREECRLAADWPLQFAGKNQTLRVWKYEPR